jgi:hypothetical protein
LKQFFKTSFRRTVPKKISVVDRHRFDADPDPIFRFDANPNPDPTSNYTQGGKSEFFLTF